MIQKKSALLVLMLLFCGICFSQQTIAKSFKIINNSSPDKEAFFISSIEKADFEQFRLKDKEVVLKFDNGFECVLMSAKELFFINNTINPSNYSEDFPIVSYALPTFNITDNGMIKARANSGDTKVVLSH